MRFAPIARRRRLYEDIVAEIERMVLAGELAEGDQLPAERELAEAFGVGRTAVREALFALDRMGLIETSSGERARVTRPTGRRLVQGLSGFARQILATEDGLRQFLEARLVLETALARRAAEIGTAEDLRLLEQALEENRRSLEDPAAFVRTDIPFHHVLPAITRNPIFVAVYEAMAAWLIEVREVMLRHPTVIADAYRAHIRIYEAIRDRDPDGAALAMREHLETVERHWREAQSLPDPPPGRHPRRRG